MSTTVLSPKATRQHARDATCGQAAAQGACADPAALVASYRAVSDTLWLDCPHVPAPLGLVSAIRRHVRDQALRLCGAALPGSGLDQLVADFAATRLTPISPDPLLPGFLARPARCCQAASCSNGDSIQVRAKLARGDLLSVLGLITCGMDEQIRKPDPKSLHAAAARWACRRRHATPRPPSACKTF